MSLAVGLQVSPDRYDVIALVLEYEDIRPDELSLATRHLMTSKDLSDEIRYGGTLTPAHFCAALRVVRRRLANARRDQWRLHNSYVNPATLDERGALKVLLAPPANVHKQKQLVDEAPEAPAPDPKPPVPRCRKHPARELIGDFCAECNVEQVAKMITIPAAALPVGG